VTVNIAAWFFVIMTDVKGAMAMLVNKVIKATLLNASLATNLML